MKGTHAHTHTHPRTRTHACPHTRTHARTHARTICSDLLSADALRRAKDNLEHQSAAIDTLTRVRFLRSV